jgi:hypothetical protein
MRRFLQSRSKLDRLVQDLEHGAFGSLVWVSRNPSPEPDDRSHNESYLDLRQTLEPPIYAEQLGPLLDIEAWLKARTKYEGDQVTRSLQERGQTLGPIFARRIPPRFLRELAGSRVGRVVERHQILRGYIDVVCSQPLVTRSQTPVLYFTLLSVPGYGGLMRENHGLGFHFHYSDDGRRRSDILLTFSRIRTDNENPVTWEPHAVNKADFKARVPTWGHDKRGSVHEVCMTDKRKRKLTDYVCPSRNHGFLIP